MDIINVLRLESKELTVTILETKILIAAKMVLRLLDPDFQLNVSELARQVDVSRQILCNKNCLYFANHQLER
ncbi:MAG TPA: hypothetical protein PKE64_21370 [Anaerolineae bacterium]|nr:hypothetical protein [Anaerolineae bacterium]